MKFEIAGNVYDVKKSEIKQGEIYSKPPNIIKKSKKTHKYGVFHKIYMQCFTIEELKIGEPVLFEDEVYFVQEYLLDQGLSNYMAVRFEHNFNKQKP